MKEIARIIRKSKGHARVEFTDGVQAIVPIELAVVGQGIDEIRLCLKSENGKKVFKWMGDNSRLFKYQKAERELPVLGGEIWEQFYEIVGACMSKFVGFKWVKSFEVKDLTNDFIADAYIKGVPVRMAERSKELRGGYIYSCIKGWLLNQYKERNKERAMFISYEECEDFLGVDDSLV